MDTLVLLGTFFVLMMIGVPIAYSLGLSALAGALWCLAFALLFWRVGPGLWLARTDGRSGCAGPV